MESGHNKMTILVVDDKLNREILSDYLTEEYTVESATNGAEALAVIGKDPRPLCSCADRPAHACHERA